MSLAKEQEMDKSPSNSENNFLEICHNDLYELSYNELIEKCINYREENNQLKNKIKNIEQQSVFTSFEVLEKEYQHYKNQIYKEYIQNMKKVNCFLKNFSQLWVKGELCKGVAFGGKFDALGEVHNYNATKCNRSSSQKDSDKNSQKISKLQKTDENSYFSCNFQNKNKENNPFFHKIMNFVRENGEQKFISNLLDTFQENSNENSKMFLKEKELNTKNKNQLNTSSEMSKVNEKENMTENEKLFYSLKNKEISLQNEKNKNILSEESEQELINGKFHKNKEFLDFCEKMCANYNNFNLNENDFNEKEMEIVSLKQKIISLSNCAKGLISLIKDDLGEFKQIIWKENKEFCEGIKEEFMNKAIPKPTIERRNSISYNSKPPKPPKKAETPIKKPSSSSKSLEKKKLTSHQIFSSTSTPTSTTLALGFKAKKKGKSAKKSLFN